MLFLEFWIQLAALPLVLSGSFFLIISTPPYYMYLTVLKGEISSLIVSYSFSILIHYGAINVDLLTLNENNFLLLNFKRFLFRMLL